MPSPRRGGRHMNEVMAVALAVVLAVLSVVWNALDFKLILNITLGSALATLALGRGLIGVLAQLEQSKALLEQSKALLVRIAMRDEVGGRVLEFIPNPDGSYGTAIRSADGSYSDAISQPV